MRDTAMNEPRTFYRMLQGTEPALADFTPTTLLAAVVTVLPMKKEP